jgi:hypothetical protein
MSSSGVLYLSLGYKHLSDLVLSVESLREHYSGLVAVATSPDDPAIRHLEVLCDTFGASLLRTVDCDPSSWDAIAEAKTTLPSLTPFDRTVYLDSDTVVCGDVTPIFPVGGETVLTGWRSWSTGGMRVKLAVRRWRPYCEELVDRVLWEPRPYVNTGVMGWGPGSIEFARDWHRVIKLRDNGKCDEMAAELVFLDHDVRWEWDRYNYSVFFSHPRLTRDNVCVYHFHRLRGWRHPDGVAVMLPRYESALRRNVAGIRSIPMDGRKWRSLAPRTQSELVKLGAIQP